MRKIISFALTALIALSLLIFAGCSSTSGGNKEGAKDTVAKADKVELLVYGGAGLKKALEDIKSTYEKEHPNVSLRMIYAGSGQLLAQLEQSGKGDVFIVGSRATFAKAQEKGLTEKEYPVAHHTPCIVVPKGNPKGITSLQDLTKPGIRVALGDPKANAIGTTSVQIMEKNHLQSIEKNVVVKTGTINELYLALKNGNADAIMATKDGALARGADTFTIIPIPDRENVDQIITATSLKSAAHQKEAQTFAAYLISEKAQNIWDTHGFKPVAKPAK